MNRLSDEKFLSKPMKRGSQVSGPEPFGCFNSGFKPIICRLKNGAYVVGLENDVLEVWETQLRKALQLGGKTHRVYRVSGRRVWYLKTARTAKAKFIELVDKREAENKAEAARVADLQAKASAGDMQAVCDLGGYL